MKRMIMMFLACVCVFLGGFLVEAAEKEVEGYGVAAGTTKASREEAVSRALRDAVERAVGAMITSESVVKDFQLLEDHIYSHVSGYVKSYEVLEESHGSGDMTQVKVKAIVEEGQLENDLRGIQVILKAKGNPKTMIVLSELIDGELSEISMTGIQIEDFFKSKSFQLVDRSQIEMIKERDSMDLDNNPDKAKILGSRFGAELVITGTAKSKLSSEVEAYGVPVYAYTGTIALKAIHADTGSILATLRGSSVGRAGNTQEAALESLKVTWEEKKEEFFGKIMDEWRNQVLNYTEYSLFISKIDPQKRESLMEGLRSISGVKKVVERTFQNNISELILEVEGSIASSLDQKIVEALPYLLLTSKSSHRLDYEVK